MSYVKIRRAINSSIKNKKDSNTSKKYLGTDVLTYRQYLSSMFIKGMSWSNWGKVWEIDHVKPLASFNLESDDEMKRAFHFTNTVPLYTEANRLKSSWFRGVKYKKGKY